MKMVKDVYAAYRQELQSLYDYNEINSITDLVLCHITGFSRAKLKAFTDTELTSEQQQAANSIQQELKTGKPVQYIVGSTEFYGLIFKVNADVLIPRPETEELVEWIIKTVKSPLTAPQKILDIGTGSGCIAISLKKNLSDSQVSAVDISPGALHMAQLNAALNNVDVNFMQADILNISDAPIIQQTYSVIVSNPPYVTHTDKQQMHTNVTNYEPHTALFVTDDEPLLFYKAVADFAISNLQRPGYLFFEINESYGQQTVDMLNDKRFTDIELRKDLYNKDRMIRALLQD